MHAELFLGWAVLSSVVFLSPLHLIPTKIIFCIGVPQCIGYHNCSKDPLVSFLLEIIFFTNGEVKVLVPEAAERCRWLQEWLYEWD